MEFHHLLIADAHTSQTISLFTISAHFNLLFFFFCICLFNLFSFQRPAPPPDVDYPLDGEKILHIKGAIRWVKHRRLALGHFWAKSGGPSGIKACQGCLFEWAVLRQMCSGNVPAE